MRASRIDYSSSGVKISVGASGDVRQRGIILFFKIGRFGIFCFTQNKSFAL